MTFDFHAGQARRTIVRAIVALCAALGARTAAAQQAAPADTAHTPGTVLPTTVITAARHSPTLAEEGILGRIVRVDREHHEVVNLMAGNRALGAYVKWQGKEITRLEARLDYLKTTVTDSLNRDIAAADSATLSVRAQRLALEARLAELEARQVARQTSAPAAPATGSAMGSGAGGSR